MLSKNRTFILGIILVLVLGLYIILSYSSDHEKNFRTNLPVIDTATTDLVIISSPENEKPVKLVRDDGVWQVEKNDAKYEANKNIVNSLILSLSNAKVISVAATSPDEWDNFKTSDDLATKVRFGKNGEVYSDVLIGRFEYIPQKNQNPYGGQPQGQMLTYVRVNGEEDVYAIEGSLGLGMGKTADDYRNKKLLHLDKKAVSSLQFDYAGRESFALTKENNRWKFDDGSKADSATMVKYLNALRYLSGRNLTDENPEKQPVFAELTITSNDKTIKLTAYTIDSVSCYLRSSQNPTNVVLDDQNKIRDRAFVGRDYLKGTAK